MFVHLKPISRIYQMHRLASNINGLLKFHSAIEKVTQENITESSFAWVKREEGASFEEAAKALRSKQLARSVYNAFFAVTQYLDLERRFAGERELRTNQCRFFSRNPRSRFELICQGKMKIVGSSNYDRHSAALPGVKSISSSRFNLKHDFYVSDEDFEYQTLMDIQAITLHFYKNLDAESVTKGAKTYVGFLNRIKRISDRKITLKDLVKWYGDDNFDTFIDKVRNFNPIEETEERPDFLPKDEELTDVMKVKLHCQIRLKKAASLLLQTA